MINNKEKLEFTDFTFTWDEDQNSYVDGSGTTISKNGLLKTIFTDGGENPFNPNFLSSTNPWYADIKDWGKEKIKANPLILKDKDGKEYKYSDFEIKNGDWYYKGKKLIDAFDIMYFGEMSRKLNLERERQLKESTLDVG